MLALLPHVVAGVNITATFKMSLSLSFHSDARDNPLYLEPATVVGETQ